RYVSGESQLYLQDVDKTPALSTPRLAGPSPCAASSSHLVTLSPCHLVIFVRSQILIVLSQLPAASLPSLEMAIQSTSPVCLRMFRSFCVATSQSFTSPGRSQSPLPVAKILLSGENAMPQTS